jgi:hypothetical protein
MTPSQIAFGAGLAWLGTFLIMMMMDQPPRAGHTYKADKLPIEQRSTTAPVTPAPAYAAAPMKIATDLEPPKPQDDTPPDAEPPPINERDLLEPGQQIELPAKRHYGSDYFHQRHVRGDVCARAGGHRVVAHGRRPFWRCLYPSRPGSGPLSGRSGHDPAGKTGRIGRK